MDELNKSEHAGFAMLHLAFPYFESIQLGVRYHRDDPVMGFNSWDLQCYSCNPKLEIIPVSQKFFTDKYAFVNAHNRRLYN